MDKPIEGESDQAPDQGPADSGVESKREEIVRLRYRDWSNPETYSYGGGEDEKPAWVDKQKNQSNPKAGAKGKGSKK
jgi:hypothetical protein